MQQPKYDLDENVFYVNPYIFKIFYGVIELITISREKITYAIREETNSPWLGEEIFMFKNPNDALKCLSRIQLIGEWVRTSEQLVERYKEMKLKGEI